MAVFFFEGGGFALGGAEEVEPLHVYYAGPVFLGGCAEDVVNLVELVDLASVAREDGVASEDLDQDTRR